ncbi:hypothetical protein ACP4OV_007373 [Aristida adscensionis]
MQIDNGNWIKGVMSKTGWRDVCDRYFAATGLRHTVEQFSSRLRQLKKLWRFIDDICKGSGLGNGASGGVTATDEWWAEKTQNLPEEYKRLREGFPPYMEELDRMFQTTVADGSSSFVAGEDRPAYVISSDDDDEEEDEETEDDDTPYTPVSAGSKRSSSSRSTRSLKSTASSPKKKKKTPKMNDLVSRLEKLDATQESRGSAVNALLNARKEREQEMSTMVQEVQQLAREAGASEDDIPVWWGVWRICRSIEAMNFFKGTKPSARLSVIKQFARVGN